MKSISWIISSYLVRTIAPYFVFSWLLLSVILFVQQASRYSDIFFSVNIPPDLVWQLTVALVPNVVAFTCPMAMLVATIIGLTKMQGDSELVAIRAAGVGNLQITLPIVIFGLVLSAFAFAVNFQGVPLAAALVRRVALQTAIKKLESPIEPGVFNSEVAGFTIYAKGGDVETGRWTNIFIYSEDKADGTARFVTSTSGRIDTVGQSSELVLEKAAITTLPLVPGEGKYVAETVGDLRFAIKTTRSDLIDKLSRSEVTAEEMGLQQLSEFAASATGQERVEAQLIWQRRVLLSVTPLIFCLLGTVIVLRFNRGGRGFGILAALVVLIGFYLMAFLGEQLARLGYTSSTIGGLIPIAGSAVVILWFGLSRRMKMGSFIYDRIRDYLSKLRPPQNRLNFGNLFVDLTTGLRDFDIVSNLIKNFLLTILFLAAIFLIFTAFELWRFAAMIEGGTALLGRYLIYLLPFVYIQISASAAMIATLATYVIKSRNNEIVTWTSSGQSVYRLLVPCFLLATFLGGINWIVQERLLPTANRFQESTRMLIRNKGVLPAAAGRSWVEMGTRIYSFDKLSQDRAIYASDNEKGDGCEFNCMRKLLILEFRANGERLQSVYRAEEGVWRNGQVVFSGPVEHNNVAGEVIRSSISDGGAITEERNPVTEIQIKPTQLNAAGLRRQMASADSEVEQRTAAVALHKKYSTLMLPFITVFFTAPFALSLSRKGKAATIGYAVGLWLVFTGISTVFDQFGLNGMLEPTVAVWAPIVFFALVGAYLLSRVRT
jgi:lipopolysaccharide export LptBFGC system permease protein LptF